MAITYPIVAPSSAIASATMYARDAVAYSESPYTYAGQAFDWGGQGWQLDVSLRPMIRSEAEEWITFLTKLRGQYGSFYMRPPGGTVQGEAGGTIYLKTSASGSELTIEGATASQTDWLKAGDFFGIRSDALRTLHKVLDDVDTNGAGEATFDIWPALRVERAAGTLCITNNPFGRWRLASNQREWSVNAAQHYGIQFSAMEAI